MTNMREKLSAWWTAMDEMAHNGHLHSLCQQIESLEKRIAKLEKR
ncbi:hypothetical protein [Parasphingorhabdus sp.]